MASDNKTAFWNGFAAGIPIGLGYFAVSFALGIKAQNAEINPLQGFIASFFNLASAGENALFDGIKEQVTYLEIAILTFVVNARYLLMSCALSQRFDEKTNFIHRLFTGFGITDEIFGVSIAQKGKLNPYYNYGAMIFSVLLWSLGTSLGIIAGKGLPERIVSALSVSLYGMFIAIIVPPARQNFVILAAVIVSFAASWGCSAAPFIKDLSAGTRTIILTVVIASVCALIKPVEDEVVSTDSTTAETDSTKIENSGESNER